MFFVVVLSLAALASAVPVTQHELQQQELEDPNLIPFYKQLYHPYSMNIYGRNNRYFPYYEQTKENYPFQPYNYKHFMMYPYRSNYFLRYMYKPEISESQPKIDYDKQNIYHVHEVNHHHMINNIHDFKQKEIIRKLDEMDYSYTPYSPMYYNKYMNMDKFYNREYPYVNKYYGKSLEQEYVQPWTTNYNSRYWDMDYIRNYYNRNVDYPISARNAEVEYVKPVVSKTIDLDYVAPTTSNNWALDYIKPVVYKSLNFELVKPVITKNLDLDYVQPATDKTLNVEYIKPVISKSLDVEHVKPIISKNLDLDSVAPVLSKNWDLDYVKPVISKSLNVGEIKPVISKNLDLDYVQQAISRGLDHDYVKPIVTKNINIDYVKPIISRKLNTDWTPLLRNLDMEYPSQPEMMKNLNVEYMAPNTHQSQDVEFIPEVNSRNLDETFVRNYYPSNWDLEQGMTNEGRFKRDVVVQAGTNIELEHQTPVSDLRHDVQQTYQAPVMTEDHQVAQEQVPQGVHVQRQDLQVNANLEHLPIPAEPVSEQPIQRQTRDTTTTQSVATTPQYVYYPYYLDPYLPVQTPLVLRSAFYPNYYFNPLYRK